MTLVAIDDSGVEYSFAKLVNSNISVQQADKILKELEDSVSFYCPDCLQAFNERLQVHYRRSSLLKDGKIRRGNFAHEPGEADGRECQSKKTTTESDYHHAAKLWAHQHYALESDIASGIDDKSFHAAAGVATRKPDVWFRRSESEIEFYEIQVSAITLKLMEQRTRDLWAHGKAEGATKVTVFWLVAYNRSAYTKDVRSWLCDTSALDSGVLVVGLKLEQNKKIDGQYTVSKLTLHPEVYKQRVSEEKAKCNREKAERERLRRLAEEERLERERAEREEQRERNRLKKFNIYYANKVIERENYQDFPISENEEQDWVKLDNAINWFESNRAEVESVLSETYKEYWLPVFDEVWLPATSELQTPLAMAYVWRPIEKIRKEVQRRKPVDKKTFYLAVTAAQHFTQTGSIEFLSRLSKKTCIKAIDEAFEGFPDEERQKYQDSILNSLHYA